MMMRSLIRKSVSISTNLRALSRFIQPRGILATNEQIMEFMATVAKEPSGKVNKMDRFVFESDLSSGSFFPNSVIELACSDEEFPKGAWLPVTVEARIPGNPLFAIKVLASGLNIPH
ncbi:hypothetical protein Droror1_Dr00015253 [Drosera rotundifolia]